MKVSVKPDGTVEFDVATAKEALDLAEESARRAAKNTEAAAAQQLKKISEGTGLTAKQYRLWSFLVENDSNQGVHVAAVSRAFGMTNTAGNQALLVLLNLGYAKRVHRGYYRAMEGGTFDDSNTDNA